MGVYGIGVENCKPQICNVSDNGIVPVKYANVVCQELMLYKSYFAISVFPLLLRISYDFSVLEKYLFQVSSMWVCEVQKWGKN